MKQLIWNYSEQTTLIPWYVKFLLKFKKTWKTGNEMRTGIFRPDSEIIWKRLFGKEYEIKLIK